MSKVRIAGAIATSNGITLYMEDGKTENLELDSWRTAAIMEQVTPALAKQGYAEIDMDTFRVEVVVQERTSGVVSFFRRAKNAVKSVLGIKPGSTNAVNTNAPQVVTPTVAPAAQVKEKSPPKADKNPKTTPAEERLPLSADPETTELVAVVNGKEISGVEALERQMSAVALDEKKAVGFQRFMERLSTVVNKRGHSVQELLNFMERGDLPIANDGSIVAYKVLTTNGARDDVFFDCHTKNVRQRVGSLVFMDEALVDPSKRTECSTGLHIARRGYLGGFSGNVITLVKVAPEDVIAVPNNEPDKMRARAYHIVAELPKDVHATLRANKPMTLDSEAAKILANVIAGNHVGVLEHVKIGAAKGGNVTITQVGESAEIILKDEQARALDDRTENAITPKAINEKLADLRREDAITGDLSSAISTPPAAPAQKPAEKPKKTTLPPAKAPAPEKTTKASQGAKKAPVEGAGLTPDQKRALDLVKGGMSKRGAENATGVSARTIGRLLAKGH